MSNKHDSKFISEMKDLLESEEKRLEKELSTIGNRFPEYGRSDEDNATEIADYQVSSSTENTIKERLDNVKIALNRISDGNYGITEEGELIPEDRLRANPAATTTIK